MVELAGLERRVAFEEQVSGDSGRPDMIVHLPGGGEFLVHLGISDSSYRLRGLPV